MNNGPAESPSCALLQMLLVRLRKFLQLKSVTQVSFSEYHTALKVSNYRVYSCPYFAAFGLHTERYGTYSVHMRENMEQKKLRILALLTQCHSKLNHVERVHAVEHAALS